MEKEFSWLIFKPHPDNSFQTKMCKWHFSVILSLLKKEFLCEHQPNCRGEDLNLQETLICEFFSNFVNFADTVSLCGINSKLAGDSDVTWYGMSQRLGCDQVSSPKAFLKMVTSVYIVGMNPSNLTGVSEICCCRRGCAPSVVS